MFDLVTTNDWKMLVMLSMCLTYRAINSQSISFSLISPFGEKESTDHYFYLANLMAPYS